mmetsp:Transcript_3139/g.4571  ORF Transcript_3139/g.4571 Transcript_3139/m.4571 type:complete len:164 (+) Transcript_3139:82-573(+)
MIYFKIENYTWKQINYGQQQNNASFNIVETPFQLIRHMEILSTFFHIDEPHLVFFSSCHDTSFSHKLIHALLFSTVCAHPLAPFSLSLSLSLSVFQISNEKQSTLHHQHTQKVPHKPKRTISNSHTTPFPYPYRTPLPKQAVAIPSSNYHPNSSTIHYLFFHN